MNKLHRNKYDTFIIYLFANRKENLLPTQFRALIPDSTASSWRKISHTEYIGQEFRNIQNEGMDWYELFRNHQKLKRTANVLAKVWLAVASFLKPILKKTDNDFFITQLQKLFTVLPQKMVLKLTDISPPSFYYKLHKLKIKCNLSPVSLCLKRHPFQLSVKEVNLMKTLFSDIRFVCCLSRLLLAMQEEKESYLLH